MCFYADDNTSPPRCDAPADEQGRPGRDQVLGSAGSRQAMIPFVSVTTVTCVLTDTRND